ncbi:OPT oligopeptide transporter protein-domain-containing protein [Colletotrichum cereale]|nr:OPT oligopeptide transporter protein-domain-containing protein [Colletotrichum cereale]
MHRSQHVEPVQGNDADPASDMDTTAAPFDAFVPLEKAPAHNAAVKVVTLRAILLGSFCGALVNASNIYLGLRVGWTTSANMIGAMVGFAVLKRYAGQAFGPHENNIVQTVATASGGMSNVFISGIPALYQLGLLRTPVEDFFRIVSLVAVGGYFGLLSMAPLRRLFVEDAARDLDLIFPSSMATAMSIHSMHSAADGEEAARPKLKATMWAFGAAMVLRVVSQYAPGLLWEWHVFTWLASANIFPNLAIAAESWGFFLEWSPAMMGTGILVDFKVASSFFAGSVLAWGIIGPYLVQHGIAFGQPVSDSETVLQGLTSYKSMSDGFAGTSHPSPRYWLLWPGVICTLAVAFAELSCQWRLFLNLGLVSLRAAMATLRRLFDKYRWRSSNEYNLLSDQDHNGTGEIEKEPEEKRVQDQGIATWMWAPGVCALVILAVLLTRWQFNMPLIESLLALFLSFGMSLVAVQATGATDTTPINSISKVSQAVLSSVTQATGGSIVDAQRLNLLGASLTNIAASQGVDLIGDFRVGFLLRTPPRLQYVAQLIGTLVATLVAPSVFVLFTTAYPCIIANPSSTSENDTAGRECEFPGPSIAAWRAVAVAASAPTPPVPLSSAWFSAGLAVASILLVLARRFLLVGAWRGAQRYMPNMMIFALAFTLPSPQTSVSMMMGAVAAKVWRWKGPVGFERYAFAVAAGLVAGEGIGGTVNCVLSIIGVGGQRWSLGVGCPAGRC